MTDVSMQTDKGKLNLHKYFTEEELDETAKELIFIEEHLNEYKSYNNILELEEDLLKNRKEIK